MCMPRVYRTSTNVSRKTLSVGKNSFSDSTQVKIVPVGLERVENDT